MLKRVESWKRIRGGLIKVKVVTWYLFGVLPIYTKETWVS